MAIAHVNLAFTLFPLVSGLVGVIWPGWQRQRRQRRSTDDDQETQARALAQEEQRRAELRRGAATLRQEHEPWQRGQGSGQIVISSVGTAAAAQLPGICEAFVRASADPFIGDILLAEPDTMSRTACLADLPAVYRDRVIPVPLPLLQGGLLGRTLSEGWALRPYWMADLMDRIDDWSRRQRCRGTPVCLFDLVSPGGSACQDTTIRRRFKQEHNQAEVYVILVLDDKTDRREINIPELLDLYDQDELVSGILVLDNRHSSQLFDQALALLLPSLVVAPWIDPRPKSGFNVLADVFRRHRVATLRTWVGYLPVHFEPPYQHTLPGFYHTNLSYAQAQALRGIEQVLSQPSLQSLPLAAASHPHFVYVAAPIRPEPEFQTLAERVRNSPIPGVTYDTPLGFASIGHPLTPDSEEAPIVVVSIVPIPSGLAGVRQLVLGQQTDVLDDPILETQSFAPEAATADGHQRR